MNRSAPIAMLLAAIGSVIATLLAVLLPSDAAAGFRTPQSLEDFGAVLGQDAIRVPVVQKGIRSRAFKGLLFGDSENRIRHYLAEVDKYLGRR